jgi:hypothetical protein
MYEDTADAIFGMPDPGSPQTSLPGPGTVGGTPALAGGGVSGLQAWHPAHSVTPWVVGMFIVLALLLHPKGGFNAGGRVSLG